MFFAVAARTGSDLVYRAIYWSKIPIIIAIAALIILVINTASSFLLSATDSGTTRLTIQTAGVLLRLGLGVPAGLLAYEYLFQWRLSPLLLLSHRIHDSISEAPDSGAGFPDRVIELHVAPFYRFFRFRRLNLTRRELTAIVYLETYRGLLHLGRSLRDGSFPGSPDLLMRATSPLLTASRRLAVLRRRRIVALNPGLNFRLSLSLALRRYPWEPGLQAPRVPYEEIYFKASEIERNLEFLEREVRRLEELTQRPARTLLSSSNA
ncbi:MAG: hypothetical protein HY650_01615 [Acidobacteria bacterium]|nr:hypothetical protein [Acidobacteriota bacterium]